MKWIADLMKRCLALKCEVVRLSKEELQAFPLPHEVVKGLGPEFGGGLSRIAIIITCPEIPQASIGNELLKMIPSDVEVAFVAALKRSTAMELTMMMAQNGMPPLIMANGRHMIINAQSPNTPEIHDQMWDRLQELLRKDGYPTSWEINISNDQKIVYDVKMAKEVETQHNVRETSIDKDAQTDLHIMLEASSSVDQFLAMLEGKPFKKPRRKSE